MSRPIKITNEMKEALKEEFSRQLAGKLFNGTVSFSKTFLHTGAAAEKAAIIFTYEAYVKMLDLINHFDSEVAWHGVVKRAEQKNTFVISDILVYPQVVTGATVNTDQKPYETWLYCHPDEVFNNIRMQGHSHVDMPTSPSSVDTHHQEKILEQLGDDDYYIFMIWNKKLQHTIKIYDMQNNILFDDSDIAVSVGEDGRDIGAFMQNAKSMVRREYYTPHTYKGGGKPVTPGSGITGQTSGTTPAANTPKTAAAPATTQDASSPKTATGLKEKAKPAIGRGWSGMQSVRNANAADFVDEDDPYGDYYDHYDGRFAR